MLFLSCVRFSGTFVGNAESASPAAATSPPAVAAATLPAVPTIPVVPTIVGVPNTVAEGVLNPNEVKPPASGTRKARVLYDYEASDSTELALLADEVGGFPDWDLAITAQQPMVCPTRTLVPFPAPKTCFMKRIEFLHEYPHLLSCSELVLTAIYYLASPK